MRYCPWDRVRLVSLKEIEEGCARYGTTLNQLNVRIGMIGTVVLVEKDWCNVKFDRGPTVICNEAMIAPVGWLGAKTLNEAIVQWEGLRAGGYGGEPSYVKELRRLDKPRIRRNGLLWTVEHFGRRAHRLTLAAACYEADYLVWRSRTK